MSVERVLIGLAVLVLAGLGLALLYNVLAGWLAGG